MRFVARWWILVATLAFGGEAMATLAITGEVLIDPPAATLLRGQTAALTLTVTNTGDEPFDDAYWVTEYFREGPTSTIFPSSTPATLPCIFRVFETDPPPNQPGLNVAGFSLHPRPIAPGESRQCVLSVQVSAQAAGPFVQTFRLRGIRANQTVSMARSVAFNLGAPSSLPVPTISAWGLALLTLLLLEIGRRRSLR